jgi:hypothetical protein
VLLLEKICTVNNRIEILHFSSILKLNIKN